LGLLKFGLSDVFFAYNGRFSPIGPLWTMGLELYGSALVFASVLFVRWTRWRWMVFAIAASVGFEFSPFYVSFVIGSIFAWIYVNPPVGAERFRALAPYVLIAGLILTWFLPGQEFNWPLVISAMLTFGAVFSPRARAFLSNKCSAFLGRISFSLYLIHAPVFLCRLAEKARTPTWRLRRAFAAYPLYRACLGRRGPLHRNRSARH
jgi:peptidoglycan/LPS O-acetylase OafA/YrhL